MSATTPLFVSICLTKNDTVILREESDELVVFSAWRYGVNNRSWGECRMHDGDQMGRIGTKVVDSRFPEFAVPSQASQHVAAYEAILGSRFAAEITGAGEFTGSLGKILLKTE